MSAPETAAEPFPDRRPDSPDRMIGKYRLVELLGRGGTGEVWRARDEVLGRDVALKLLREANDPEGAAKLLREARSAAQFNHPNVVTVHEIEVTGDTCCIVMEFVRGASAAQTLRRRGRLPWREATHIVADACRGLAAAHRAGLIHRDLKPSNIMIADDGAAKLADFGLARSSENSLPSLPGSVAGTPNYMSPEQCRGDRLDARSDIYSLGATYYTLLTGGPPFAAEVPLQVMFAHVARPMPDPALAAPDLPDACREILRKATAKEPADRFGSADEFLKALEGLLSAPAPAAPAPVQTTATASTPPRARGRLMAASVGLLAAAAAVGWVLLSGMRGGTPEPSDAPGGPRGSLPSPSAPVRDATPSSDRGNPSVAPLTSLLERIPAEGLRLEMDGRIAAVAFSPDGRWFAAANSGKAGGTLVWDGSGRRVGTIPTVSDTRSIAISRDGRLAAGDLSGRVRVWKLPAGEPEESPAAFTAANIGTIEFHPDGRRIAIGALPWEGARSDGAHLRLIDRTSPHVRHLSGHTAGIWTTAFSPDGKRLVSSSRDGTVRIWDVASETALHVLAVGRNPQGYSPCAAYLPDGTVVVAARGSLLFYRGDGVKAAEDWTIGHEVTALACCPAGRLVAVFTTDMRLRFWSPAQRRQTGVLVTDGDVGGAAFSPDGTLLLAGTSHNAAFLWDVRRFRGP